MLLKGTINVANRDVCVCWLRVRVKWASRFAASLRVRCMIS